MAAHILAVGKYSKGHNRLVVAPHNEQVAAELDAYLSAPDGALQQMIDHSEDTAEYEDWLEDLEWMRRGC